MSLENEEPQFVRLWLPKLSLWVESYRIAHGGLIVGLTVDKTASKIFVSPNDSDLKDISRRLSPVQVCEADFSEWVSQ